MSKDKHTGLGEVDVTGAAAVVDTLISKSPKIPKVRLDRAKKVKDKKVDSEIPKRDVTKLKLPEFHVPQSEKLQVPMDYELIDALGKITKWIMTRRKKGQQRITKNSIVRACLNVLLPMLYADPEKLKDISTEQELVERISDLLKKSESKA